MPGEVFRIWIVLVTVISFLHLSSEAQEVYDYGAKGLPRAAQRLDQKAFIGSPDGGPWIDGESDETDSSESDGIQFSANGREVTVYISQDGVLAGWMDFDWLEGAEADFSQPGDDIIPPQLVSAGYNSFSFNWPQGYVPGPEIWARFRFSLGRQASAVASPVGISGSSGEVQDYFLDLTPVELDYFEAHPAHNVILLKWQTHLENGHQGFYLFRSDAKEGPFEKISRILVKRTGPDGLGNRYEYADSTIEPGKHYYYKLADVDKQGYVTTHDPIDVTATTPVDYLLEQIYPNPFNPETRINFSLKEACNVLLAVFDRKGKEVRRLMAGALPMGPHTISWNGKDDHGKSLSSDTYFYKLQVNDYEISRRIEFVR